jgi:hypothetical protein
LSNPEAKKALEQKYNLPEDYCGPCYGANPDNVENPCCNTCEEIQRVYGTLGWGINTDNFEQVIRPTPVLEMTRNSLFY